jgi:hypothetical protein
VGVANHTYPLVSISGINCPLSSVTGVYEPPVYRIFDEDSNLNLANVPGVGAGAALPPANATNQLEVAYASVSED